MGGTTQLSGTHTQRDESAYEMNFNSNGYPPIIPLQTGKATLVFNRPGGTPTFWVVCDGFKFPQTHNADEKEDETAAADNNTTTSNETVEQSQYAKLVRVLTQLQGPEEGESWAKSMTKSLSRDFRFVSADEFCTLITNNEEYENVYEEMVTVYHMNPRSYRKKETLMVNHLKTLLNEYYIRDYRVGPYRLDMYFPDFDLAVEFVEHGYRTPFHLYNVKRDSQIAQTMPSLRTRKLDLALGHSVARVGARVFTWFSRPAVLFSPPTIKCGVDTNLLVQQGKDDDDDQGKTIRKASNNKRSAANGGSKRKRDGDHQQQNVDDNTSDEGKDAQPTVSSSSDPVVKKRNRNKNVN